MKKSAGDRWAGALQGFAGGLLYGWCIDTQEPDARVVLEVFEQGYPVGTVVADVARPDLLGQFGKLGRRAPADPCHGFVADLGAGRLPSGDIRVRVANTACYIGHPVSRDSLPPPSTTAATFVFSDGGLRLHGWLGPSAKPQKVRAFLGPREIASAMSGKADSAMRVAVDANSFVLDLPPELADGNAHSVRVVDANGIPLNGSPITVCCLLHGGKALLEGGDKALLATVLDHYERFVPRSLDWSCYGDWAAAFEPPAARAGRKAKVAVIISPARDAAAIKVTEASLASQRGVSVRSFVHAGGPVSPLLQRATQDGYEFVACIRAGDELPAHALATAIEGFVDAKTQVVYTDSEFRGTPWFKPAWNLEYALASDCALELMVTRTPFAQRCAQESAPNDPASLAWNVLAQAHRAGPRAIGHLPRVLYITNSPPAPEEIAQRTAAAQQALRTLEPESRLEASAFLSPDGLFRPRRPVRPLSRAERKTRVSLIIPTRDRAPLLRRCIDSLRQHTDWPALEIIVIDNDSAEEATHKYLRSLQRTGIRVLPHPGPFNFAAMNNAAVQAAKGEIVGLINNDIDATHDGWLDEIVGQLLRPGVGIVGAKLLWPNGMVQHGGVVLGMGNGASHFGNRLADGDWGDHGRNQLVQQVSAVTAACLFIRRADYLAVGGMDANAFPVNFNDVDLCLKIRAQGKTVVWTPLACLLHAESASRGKDEAPHLRARVLRELENLRTRWGHVLLKDPAYHPSLNLDPHSHPFGGLAIPPRDRSARLASLPSR